MKTILVACGAAVATSTVVARKIEEIAAKHHIDLQTIQARAKDVGQKITETHPDAIVCTCQVEGVKDIPVLNGRSFLTGINMDEMTEKLLEVLKK